MGKDSMEYDFCAKSANFLRTPDVTVTMQPQTLTCLQLAVSPTISLEL